MQSIRFGPLNRKRSHPKNTKVPKPQKKVLSRNGMSLVAAIIQAKLAAMKGGPILYVRRGCSWCREALAFFSSHGVPIEIHDVDRDYAMLKDLIEVSGQTQTPTFEYGDFIVSDFSVDEFLDELQERPDIQMRLGITDDSHIA